MHCSIPKYFACRPKHHSKKSFSFGSWNRLLCASSSATSSKISPMKRIFTDQYCCGEDMQNRCFSIDTSVTKAFDRELKKKQRDNAARSTRIWRSAAMNVKSSSENDDNDDDDTPIDIIDYDYFRQEIANRLVDRLDDIKKAEGFPLGLDIGADSGQIYRTICSDDAFEGEGGIGGIRKMVLLDSSDGMLHVNDDDKPIEGAHRCDVYKLHADEEEKLPFPDGTFDLVMSSQSIHWVNDLPKLFQEVFRVLKPDGCFMFSMIGGSTLPELRIAMTLAELEREGGMGAHVGPFVELSDVGSLLQNAGFALPTIDIDTVKISYPSAPVLMEHLQRMGEGNASLRRRKYTGKDVFLAASCIYDEMYPYIEGEASRDIEATAQVIFAIGWTPHSSQQTPERRGTAKHRLGDDVVIEHSDNNN
mmetsp:Transcript_3905/g.4329  ORF Transcript_3905/g.4329 Transcript_3905/m.4329 type:complete len:418 (+) Transcript_3905:102-1355(+)